MPLCIRCGKRTKKPYWYHKRCRELADAERRASIEALPEKPVTLEVWCRMWGMALEEGRESYANWRKHDRS